MELPFCHLSMEHKYQELFDHVAFPVFALDADGRITYRNPQSKRYQKSLRCNAKLQKHQKPSPHEQIVILSGETPYSVGVNLRFKDGSICLFLSRFQYPDGMLLISNMLETFGKGAEDFISKLKTAAVTSPFNRAYTELSLITEHEDRDFGISLYSLEALVRPFFEKLRRFSALGYRIEADCKQINGRCPVKLSTHDFFHRLSHILYLLMKISADKNISISLFTDEEKERHLLSIQTQTQMAPATYTGEALASVLPECKTEITLLSAYSSAKESISLTIEDGGKAHFLYEIPYEKATHALPLHSRAELISPERRAESFIRKLFKRFC